MWLPAAKNLLVRSFVSGPPESAVFGSTNSTPCLNRSRIVRGEARRRRSARPAGFSLMELLVVISIIGILAGLLLPAMATIRAYSRKVVCGSNLKQVSVAIELHKSDHGDRYPAARYMPEPFFSSDPDPPLPAVLSGYLSRPANERNPLFECPGDLGYVYELSASSYMYQSELSGVRMDQFLPVVHMGVPPARVVVARDFDSGVFDLQDGQTLAVPSFHRLRNLMFGDGHVGNFP
jgi:prepilin-type N-terminal cleavage/methylation domain-containing protein